MTLTRIECAEGEGVNNDPVRIVTYWYTDQGDLIAREDPYALISDEEAMGA